MTAVDDLTPREREVIDLMVDGLTYKQIGEKLVISPRTVRTHASFAFDKLGANSRIEVSAIIWSQRLAQKQQELDALRQQIADAKQESTALQFYLNRMVSILTGLFDS